MNNFSLFSIHGEALLQLAQNPRARVSHIADTLNISERAARRVIVDLEDAGFLTQHRKGRYVVYTVQNDLIESLLAFGKRLSSQAESPEAVDSKRLQVSQQLLNASYHLMDAGKSFWELSVDELITEAGIGRSTFYAYFEDKSTLLETRLKELLEDMWQVSVQMTALPEEATKDDLIESINKLVEVYRPHKYLLAAASEAGSNRPVIAELYANLMNRTIEIMTNRIDSRSGNSAGSNDGSSRWTATMLTWGTEYGLNSFFSKASKKQTQRLVMSLADIIWNLFYAKAAVINEQKK